MADNKNERRPHSNSLGREPKKGGGGGKGTWGKPGDEAIAIADKKDPNYDSEEDEAIVYDEAHPQMDLAEFKKLTEEILEEYFTSSDTAELGERLRGLDAPQHHPEFVKKAVISSLDKKARERQLTSELLSSLFGSLLTATDVCRGLDLVLDRMEDLALDCPDAKDAVGHFIARAVADDVVAPVYISNVLQHHSSDSLAGATVLKAKTLVNMKHSGTKLEKVWGPGDGRPVEELKESILMLLQEYLQAADLEEAARCVEELNAPHFHHDVVKKGVIMVLDKTTRELELMSKLFGHLVKISLLASEQCTRGFQRVVEVMDDVKLDCPSAFPTFVKLSHKAVNQGYLDSNWAETLGVK